MPSKHFHNILEKMKEIHDKKNHDYAKESNPFSNFTFSAEVVKHFTNPIDQVFASLISIKLARLSELLSGKEAKNESINDTFIYLANYSALWGAYYLGREEVSWGTVPEELRNYIPKKEYLVNYYPGPDGNKCVKCTMCFTNLEEYKKHAIDMHAAQFNKNQNLLKFNDTIQVLP